MSYVRDVSNELPGVCVYVCECDTRLTTAAKIDAFQCPLAYKYVREMRTQ